MKVVHTPVMLEEVVNFLSPSQGRQFIDATLGAAGHTMALLDKGATVIGIDRDADILNIATKRIEDAGLQERFTAMHSAFADALRKLSFEGGCDGILFDLGVSSYQLDTSERGFSFRHDAPLDMRMDRSLSVTAADLVNGLGKKELIELFTVLGEERHAAKIALRIIDRRHDKPLRTTRELADLIESLVPHKGRIHPATRVFQALRMAVNSEREELKAALPSALSLLSSGGVLAVITFQSLEEAIVKEFFAAHAADLSFEGVATPNEDEIKANIRSRSAKLYKARKK